MPNGRQVAERTANFRPFGGQNERSCNNETQILMTKDCRTNVRLIFGPNSRTESRFGASLDESKVVRKNMDCPAFIQGDRGLPYSEM